MAQSSISQQKQSGLVPFPLIPRQREQYLDVPFVIPALTFPWDIFSGIEEAYYQHLYDVLREERMNRSDSATNVTDVALDLELATPTNKQMIPRPSDKVDQAASLMILCP